MILVGRGDHESMLLLTDLDGLSVERVIWEVMVGSRR